MAMAISVVAVLSIAAAAVLGVVATRPATAGPADYMPVMSETDYLIYELTDSETDEDDVADAIDVVAVTDDPYLEEVFAVKREMSIKTAVWDSPAPPTKQWTKVLYTVNIRLRDLAFTDPVTGLSASIEPVNLVIGSLGALYNGVELALVSESFTVNGCVLVDSVGTAADAVAYDDVNGVWNIALPSLDGFVVSGTGASETYDDGDSISVSLMLKAPYIAGSALDVTEMAFDAIMRTMSVIPAPLA